jgi:NADH-quinone oxidoreductase subunit H
MTFWNDPINFIGQWLQTVLTQWGVAPEVAQIIVLVLGAAILGVLGLVWVIFLIWYERKIIGRIQDRLGPNRVGPWGVFQPVADMLKIFTKEYITPEGADRVPYNLAPVLAVAGVLMIWGVIPFASRIFGADISVAVLFVVAAGAIGELGILFAGWGSNNKYAMLGAFRSVAQLISYEIPMVITLLIPVMLSGSMSLQSIVQGQSIWYLFLAPLPALIFLISQIAEVGRAPFDLIEAESEIVAGFNIEYSGLKFGMFFVAEFLHAFTAAILFAVLFMGGWRGPFADQVPFLGFVYLWVKTFLVYFLTILIRGTVPRFRVDQMMDINWKLLTPLSLAMVLVTALVANLVKPFNSPVVTLAALLLANLVMLMITLQFMRGVGRGRRRPMVAPSTVVVARPEPENVQPNLE